MVKNISMTAPGVKSYPLHCHDFCEIMYYTEGTGFLRTDGGDCPFSPKTAIIVPPRVRHGSVSENGFKNISVGGDFYVGGTAPLAVVADADAQSLVWLIFKNRFGSAAYLGALANSYFLSLLQSTAAASPVAAAVERIAAAVSERACDPMFHIADALNASGYAEDYIRAQFKALRGETPTAFLHRLRIQNACHMLEVFGDAVSVAETAFAVGFTDAAYFSRVFTRLVGESPGNYKKKSSAH